MTGTRPCLLMILDGWGIAPPGPGNAVTSARTPNLDALMARYPVTELVCCGMDVGLPQGVMGNSEVGHLNIGAGRVVYQDLLRIDRAIEDDSFFSNAVLCKAMDAVRDRNRACHIMGLLSDAGVHSRMNHLKSLIRMACERGISRIVLHPVMDGRDSSPESGIGFLKDLKDFISPMESVFIGTLCGRFYTMDRDTRWERTEKAFRLYTEGLGIITENAFSAMEASYASGITDEFIEPYLLKDAQGRDSLIREGDLVLFFNFRADRARQITRAFTQKKFDAFPRRESPMPEWICMTRYDEHFDLPVAFGPESMKGLLGEVVSLAGLSQLRIAETEKYAHVTYFFNGGEEKAFQNEERILIPSPREISTYDEKPSMSADEVAESLKAACSRKDYSLVVLNFANMDMVGHTGNFEAACAACEAVDRNVGKLIPFFREKGFAMVVIADHGNAERMFDEKGKAATSHTLNPVPFILVDDERQGISLLPGRLCDVAPTILSIMGLEIPPEMTGKNLVLS
ncbi:2,3-bisphosphoglycerate-independent phosphoglycerate mutase [Desulfococcaceae bacterium OttesenSCG-928-F15]|nr:2,3-bisphosphoglycerate-independent phosphoglycerate mutase [Desulfococcaceae bacterium OttesenSCG-928-F15]